MTEEVEIHKLDQYLEGEQDKALQRILTYGSGKGKRTSARALEKLQQIRPELGLTDERIERVLRRTSFGITKPKKP